MIPKLVPIYLVLAVFVSEGLGDSVVTSQQTGEFVVEQSPNQLERTPSFKVLIVPGSELDNPGYTNISNRYDCGSYKFSFVMGNPISNPRMVNLTVTLDSWVHSQTCTVSWGDHQSHNIEIKKGVSEMTSHIYGQYGIFVVTGTCSGKQCPAQDTSCVTTSTFFDDFFKTVSTPLKYMATDPITINSLLRLNKACSTGPVVIIWRLTHVINDTYTEEVSIDQPDSSILTLGAETLDPGEYIVFLEVSHPGQGTGYWIEDFLFMEIVLPELVPIIDGGHLRDVSYGGILYINASSSADPITMIPSVTSLQLTRTWSFAHYASKPLIAQLELFEKSFPESAPLPTSPSPNKHNVTQDNGDLLEIDTSLFAVNSWAIVMFTMIRGERKSSTVQIIQFLNNTIPVTISCIYNCNKGRERKFNYERMELDSTLSDGLISETFSYTWTMFSWYVPPVVTSNGTTRTPQPPYWSPKSISTTTDTTSQSIAIPKSTLTEGDTYRVSLEVSGIGYTDTVVELYGTVNSLPYNGDCSMSDTSGEAARTWFVFTCVNWYGADQRRSKSSSLDTNPLLTFTANQYTAGALVEEEPILLTRALTSYFILKLGDPNNDYSSTLKVHVTDIYRNYKEFDIEVTANPAFAWDQVTADQSGRDIITAYTNVDYVEDERELVAMGKLDLIVSLVSSVSSHIHLIDTPQDDSRIVNQVQCHRKCCRHPKKTQFVKICPSSSYRTMYTLCELPQRESPVQRKLNEEGSIVDLKPNGNDDVGGFSHVLEVAETIYVDPATLALMEVIQNMTNVLRNSSIAFEPNSTTETDKFLGSILTNAFNNLAAKPQYVNDDTQLDMIYLSDLVGTRNLDFKVNSTEDQSAEIEVISGEVYNMSQSIVNNVVPDDLNQFVYVDNLQNGRTQISDMLAVVGKNISIDNSSLSPSERAQLYLTLQFRLQTQLDAKKQTAKSAARMALKLFRNVQDTFKVCATCSNKGNSFTKQLVLKNTARHVQEAKYSTNSSEFQVDGIKDIIETGIAGDSETTSISAVEFDENIFMYDDDQKSSAVTSKILHIDVKLSDNIVNPKSMTFNQTVASPSTQLYLPNVAEEDASEFSIHTFIYKYSTDVTCLKVRPANESSVSQYKIYVRFRYVPTILEFDFITSVSRDSNWKVYISPDLMQGYTGLVVIGIQVPEEVRHIEYYYTVVTMSCVTWEEGVNKWHSDKCDLEWHDDENILSCSCRNLTELTFGNTFYVAPNTIDFSTVFLKFSPLNQAAVFGAIGAMFVLYIIVLVIVIPLDRKDLLKWGITPLRDNIYGDSMYYIVKVFTGLRRGGGTTSRVAFVLSGDGGDTGPRELYDGSNHEFSTGSVRAFFMATSRHLGTLFHLYIWHDNSGTEDSASWYLSRIEVYDITTNKSYAFVAETWLSVATDLDLEIKGTPPDETLHFDSRFFYQARDRLSDSHMWVSILYRPQRSVFTRAQRASCALTYIFLTMIANAMYFNPEDNYESVPAIAVGPFRFTLKQVYISIVCALVTTPAIMLIVYVFKRSRPTTTVHKKSCCCCCRKSEDERREELDILPLSYGIPDLTNEVYLPHGFVYLGWLLVIAGTAAPAFFIVLYSMEWGKQKSEEWLTTFVLSIFESMLVVDPIMVIAISFILACMIRKPKSQLNVDVDQIVRNYKKRQGQNKDKSIDYFVHVFKRLVSDYHRDKHVPISITPPIKGEKLSEAGETFTHRKRLASVLMDLVSNFILLLVLLTVAYNNRDDRSYWHQQYMINQLVDPNYIEKITLSPRFNKIKTHGELFDWVNHTVFPSLFPEEDLTGQTLHWTLREYMNGLENYRLGPPRIRQLRISKEMCDIPRYGYVGCYDKYAILSEHTGDYCIGWTSQPCPVYMVREDVSLDAWRFTPALDIWGFPIPGIHSTYGGGGYLATFGVNLNYSIAILNELHQERWLDRQTRAVFFEFTLYCASTNIFIYSSFLVEFLETGGALTSFSIYPMRLYNHVGPIGILILVCEIIFVIYVFFLLGKICVRLYQKRCGFFRNFWLIVDMAICVLAVASIVIFIIRLRFTDLTIERFQKDNKEFVNFSHIVFWDQCLVVCLAFLIFLATIRVLEIFGEAKKVQAVIKIFQRCGGDLVSFGTMFIYLFLGFCILGCLLFGSQMWAYMSVYRSIGTLFIAILGVTKYAEINNSHPILAKVFFFLYVLCIVFFVFSIFLSILGGSIDEVVQETRQEKRQDIIDYMMGKMKSLIVSPDTNKGKRHTSRSNKDVLAGGSDSFNRTTLPYVLTKGTSVGPSLQNVRDIQISC